MLFKAERKRTHFHITERERCLTLEMSMSWGLVTRCVSDGDVPLHVVFPRCCRKLIFGIYYSTPGNKSLLTRKKIIQFYSHSHYDKNLKVQETLFIKKNPVTYLINYRPKFYGKRFYLLHDAIYFYHKLLSLVQRTQVLFTLEGFIFLNS